MKRRKSEKILGKLLFGAFMMFVKEILKPIPVLGVILNIVALAA